MITPPKKTTLQTAQIFGLFSAATFGPLPHVSAGVGLLGLVILVLGCKLKNF